MLVRKTSPLEPANGEAADGQGDLDEQSRGVMLEDQGDDGKAARVRRPRGKTKEEKKKNARDIKVVNVPRDVCKLLDLEAIETDRTQSEVVVALLRRHLPNRYTSIRNPDRSGED